MFIEGIKHVRNLILTFPFLPPWLKNKNYCAYFYSVLLVMGLERLERRVPFILTVLESPEIAFGDNVK
jgi:hypothetical protein